VEDVATQLWVAINYLRTPDIENRERKKIYHTLLPLLPSEIPSGICAKLRTVAARNNRVHMPWSVSAYASHQVQAEITRHDHSFIACSRNIYVWCCSSHTSRSWWITQSTQHHRRGCNTTWFMLPILPTKGHNEKTNFLLGIFSSLFENVP